MPWFLLSLILSQPAAADLTTRIQKVIETSGQSSAEVAVYAQRLDGGAPVAIDADKSFHAASTMKVPVMIELFRQAEAGRLSLDEPLPVRNEFHSIVDGSVYTMDVTSDSDSEVYKADGKTLTLRQLCDVMITSSSNFAANLLIERLGANNVQATVERLGGRGVVVLRGVEDQKAFDKGMNNVTTASGLAALFTRIASGTAVSARADEEMMSILRRQKFNDAIPAGLPSGTSVAHKTGNITGIHHDAGVVLGPHPYVLVVLVRGIQDQKVSGALIAAISREVWNEFR
jgi:beta-lactamase class A